MEARPHQIEFANKLYEVLKKYGYAYLAGKPRSGKTLTAILAVEQCQNINNVIVFTKKKAIDGWKLFLDEYPITKKYTVVNYEKADKLAPVYDLAIIDESHNIGSFPKFTNRWVTIRSICIDIPHIHLSGTAIIESPCSIFHQMAISKYNPFPFRSFYDFHSSYGQPYTKFIAGRQIIMYDKCNKYLLPAINKFTIYMTQEDAGISKDLQSVDKVHYIELTPETKKKYNDLVRKRVIEEQGFILWCDSTMKLRMALHQIEGGALKMNDNYVDLGNREKVNYILENFGDNEDVGIMCHFIGESNMLKNVFKKAKIYSSSAHAEGVDLSHLKHFIIYSSDYSGAKAAQRRERIININGSNTLICHHLLVKKAVSEQVYNATSKKLDFNNSTYESKYLT